MKKLYVNERLLAFDGAMITAFSETNLEEMQKGGYFSKAARHESASLK